MASSSKDPTLTNKIYKIYRKGQAGVCMCVCVWGGGGGGGGGEGKKKRKYKCKHTGSASTCLHDLKHKHVQ